MPRLKANTSHGHLPSTTDERYIGHIIKCDKRAPWQPRMFHFIILSLHDIDNVGSPRPGLVRKTPIVWYPRPGLRGSCFPPGAHFAPVLFKSLHNLSFSYLFSLFWRNLPIFFDSVVSSSFIPFSLCWLLLTFLLVLSTWMQSDCLAWSDNLVSKLASFETFCTSVVAPIHNLSVLSNGSCNKLS